MKRVLIVGSNSYIGCAFERYVQGRLQVTTANARNEEWKKIDYSDFDSVFYVAGIAHRKQASANQDLYFKINRDLAVSVAQKAKDGRVRQFVFFSSLYAFGVKNGEITENTILNPPENDYYGLSKYQAEKLIGAMQTSDFKVAIIRPPMVYGPQCKGNFPLLIRMAKWIPFIPTLKNMRSMIYIDNLTELMAIVVEQGAFGILCPQNKEYVCTSNMLETVQKTMGKKIRRFPMLNILINVALPFSATLQSAFGNLYYDADISEMPFERKYQIVGFEESIRSSIER